MGTAKTHTLHISFIILPFLSVSSIYNEANPQLLAAAAVSVQIKLTKETALNCACVFRCCPPPSPPSHVHRTQTETFPHWWGVQIGIKNNDTHRCRIHFMAATFPLHIFLLLLFSIYTLTQFTVIWDTSKKIPNDNEGCDNGRRQTGGIGLD